MRHAFIDIGNLTMCQRCGREVFRIDEECPGLKPDQQEYLEKIGKVNEYDPSIVVGGPRK